MQTRWRTCWKLVVGLCGIALAQASPIYAQPTNDIAVKAGSVSDSRRSSGRSACTVWLQFETPAGATLNSTVTRAVDDLGNELTPDTAASEVERQGSQLNVWRERAGRSISRVISLKSPPREAKTIRLLEGEVELADPTLANGGIVVITNFLATPGTPLAHPALQEARVRLTPLTRSQYEERKATVIQTNQSLYIHAGRDSLPPITVDAERDPKMYVILEAGDPAGNLLGVLFEDAQGRALPVGGTRSTAGLSAFHFQQPLPAELNLRVFLASPASRSKAKFKVENIPLP